MPPRESYIVSKIITALGALEGCYALKVHQTRYSRAGEPDVLGVYKGRAFAIEVKRPGGRPTPLQLHRLDRWAKAGASVGIATSVAEAKAIATEPL